MTPGEIKKMLLEREASRAYHEWHRQKVIQGIRKRQQRIKELTEHGNDNQRAGLHMAQEEYRTGASLPGNNTEEVLD